MTGFRPGERPRSGRPAARTRWPARARPYAGPVRETGAPSAPTHARADDQPPKLDERQLPEVRLGDLGPTREGESPTFAPREVRVPPPALKGPANTPHFRMSGRERRPPISVAAHRQVSLGVAVSEPRWLAGEREVVRRRSTACRCGRLTRLGTPARLNMVVSQGS